MARKQPHSEPKPPSPGRNRDDADRGKADTEAERQEEEIRREQAVKPALMPIGDPAGAA